MSRDISKTQSKQEPRKCVLCITIWDKHRNFGYAEIETPEGPKSAYIPGKVVSRLKDDIEPLAYYSAYVVDNPREAARDSAPYMAVGIDIVNVPSTRQTEATYLVDG